MAAVISAALIVALLGLAVLLTLQALGVPEMLAGVTSAAANGRMDVGQIVDTMARSQNVAYTYLSK
jgi:hypothetical protein